MLLELQKPPDRRADPDELLFQIVHQIEELQMKLIVHELGESVLCLDRGDWTNAVRAFVRIDKLQVLCVRQLEPFETMLPSAFLAIRGKLGQGSGLDSPGFNSDMSISTPRSASREGTRNRTKGYMTNPKPVTVNPCTILVSSVRRFIIALRGSCRLPW